MTTMTDEWRRWACGRLSRPFSVAWLLVGLLAGPWTVASALADTVVIMSRNDCARLVAHQPTADATYTPGVDVHGRPVAPADLPDTPQLTMPEEVAIDITVELQKRFNIPANSALYKPEATVGTVVVKQDGSATFNGQPLTSPEAQALAMVCQTQSSQAVR